MTDKAKKFIEEEQESRETIVFIDAENVSVTEFEAKYKGKIKRFAKKQRLDLNKIKFRAYAVEDAPTSTTWKADNVTMIKIPGKPKENKADNQIIKELLDQAGRGRICLLLTHDKGLQKKVDGLMENVILFDK